MTILFGVVTDQFELEVSDVSQALDFDESKVQPYKRIVRAGLINARKMTDSCRARSTKVELLPQMIQQLPGEVPKVYNSETALFE